ncbi:NAD(P)-dependent oxidoreductase [Limnobacter parvus]|uniref:Hydroxyacid dehydrogenase n=1 Tax=Limnobacter parvus TaxID=2939690 RepID=A0ABT1XDZ7_9BURK|nr:NAD(P)-dependent oxidoreductase [Limnobacter parvus]MCR2745498.1 hypothetical protein [Limnobacter parvus]
MQNVGARDHNQPIQVLLAEPMGTAAMGPIGLLPPRKAQVTSVPAVVPSALQSAVVAAMKDRKTDLLVVRGNCPVNEQLIDQLSEDERPSCVLRAGTGMDNLDINYLKSVGIACQNTPDVNTQATGELAVALMLDVSRKISQANAQVKDGIWNRGALTGSELGGKTLGIVGVGRIGGVVGTVAKALGMNVIGLMSTRQPAEQKELPPYLSEKVSLDELCQRADVLTVHLPLSDSTRNLIGAKQIAQLSGRNAVVINTARGGIVDEKALLEALDNGQIAGAGLDVFVHDPAPPGSVSDQLAKHKNVIATPHVGGQTTEASQRMGQAVENKAEEMFAARLANQQRVGL